MKKGKQEIILIGGGGHCSSVIDVIELQGLFKIAGIVDTAEKKGLFNTGYQIIGTDDDLDLLVKEYHNFFITLGHLRNPSRRIELFNLIKSQNAVLPVVISPLAYVSRYAKIGEGTVIMHMAQINVNVSVGRNCIINSKALIEHNAKVGDHCHISTNATINGGTEVGNESFVGSGAVCRDNIIISPGSFIKANSLVS